MVANNIVLGIRRGHFLVLDRGMNRALPQIGVGRYLGRQKGVENHDRAHHLPITPNTKCNVEGKSIVHRESVNVCAPRKERRNEEGSLRFHEGPMAYEEAEESSDHLPESESSRSELLVGTVRDQRNRQTGS